MLDFLYTHWFGVVLLYLFLFFAAILWAMKKDAAVRAKMAKTPVARRSGFKPTIPILEAPAKSPSLELVAPAVVYQAIQETDLKPDEKLILGIGAALLVHMAMRE